MGASVCRRVCCGWCGSGTSEVGCDDLGTLLGPEGSVTADVVAGFLCGPVDLLLVGGSAVFPPVC